jgi:hypothetical protein
MPYKPLVAPSNWHGFVSAAGGRVGVPAAAALSRAPRTADAASPCDGKRAA